MKRSRAALARALGSQTFRPYHTTDVRGVEIGGAAKNVLAIAAGIVEGRKLGASATAALVTRGFAELARFGRALRRAQRNADRPVGPRRSHPHLLVAAVAQLLARHRARRRPCAPEGKLAEGAFTAAALVELASEKSVEMPIAAAVAAVIDGRLSVDQAIEVAADAAVPGGITLIRSSPRKRRDPGAKNWMPAFAGMTGREFDVPPTAALIPVPPRAASARCSASRRPDSRRVQIIASRSSFTIVSL